jgi:hypothetical protein
MMVRATCENKPRRRRSKRGDRRQETEYRIQNTEYRIQKLERQSRVRDFIRFLQAKQILQSVHS